MADRLGVDEHEIEKTDTLLAGIAIQLLASGEYDRTGVLIKDRHAAEAAQSVLENTEYERLVRIFRGKPFIDWALAWAGEDYSSDRAIF